MSGHKWSRQRLIGSSKLHHTEGYRIAVGNSDEDPLSDAPAPFSGRSGVEVVGQLLVLCQISNDGLNSPSSKEIRGHDSRQSKFDGPLSQ